MWYYNNQIWNKMWDRTIVYTFVSKYFKFKCEKREWAHNLKFKILAFRSVHIYVNLCVFLPMLLLRLLLARSLFTHIALFIRSICVLWYKDRQSHTMNTKRNEQNDERMGARMWEICWELNCIHVLSHTHISIGILLSGFIHAIELK